MRLRMCHCQFQISFWYILKRQWSDTGSLWTSCLHTYSVSKMDLAMIKYTILIGIASLCNFNTVNVGCSLLVLQEAMNKFPSPYHENINSNRCYFDKQHTCSSYMLRYAYCNINAGKFL